MSNPANDHKTGFLRLLGDEDIRSYVDGGLSPERRREVEGYLAGAPDVAARMMTALHMSRPG